jgi:hypothetical protein
MGEQTSVAIAPTPLVERERDNEQAQEIARLHALLEAAAASLAEVSSTQNAAKDALDAELESAKRTTRELRFKEERLPNFAGGSTGKHGGRTVVVVVPT